MSLLIVLEIRLLCLHTNLHKGNTYTIPKIMFLQTSSAFESLHSASTTSRGNLHLSSSSDTMVSSIDFFIPFSDDERDAYRERVDVPTSIDVMCGTGHEKNHSGNELFKLIVSQYVQQYSNAQSKKQKMQITQLILSRLCASGVRFLKKECSVYQSWYVAEPKVARDKIGHFLRLHLAESARASTQKCAAAARRQITSSSSSSLSSLPSSRSSILLAQAKMMNGQTNYIQDSSEIVGLSNPQRRSGFDHTTKNPYTQTEKATLTSHAASPSFLNTMKNDYSQTALLPLYTNSMFSETKSSSLWVLPLLDPNAAGEYSPARASSPLDKVPSTFVVVEAPSLAPQQCYVNPHREEEDYNERLKDRDDSALPTIHSTTSLKTTEDLTISDCWSRLSFASACSIQDTMKQFGQQQEADLFLGDAEDLFDECDLPTQLECV
jgi:hypothetical protein